MMLSVIPLWETEDGKLKSLKLMPIELSKGKTKSEEGLPRRTSPEEVIDYISEMSAPYGVTFKATSDGLIECFW